MRLGGGGANVCIRMGVKFGGKVHLFLILFLSQN